MIEISIFIDSSVLVAYVNKRDRNHENSIKIMNGILSAMHGAIIISDYIFDETVTVCLARTRSLEIAKVFGNYLLNSQMRILRVDQELFDYAWDIFQQIGKLSFTDCTILSMIKILGIPHLATFDKELMKIASLRGVKIVEN